MHAVPDLYPQGDILLLVGPSAVGKTTTARALRSYGFREVVSTTTRAPRLNEVEGEDYEFVTLPVFQRMVADDEFAEQMVFAGNHYGITHEALARTLGLGPVVIVVNVEGRRQLVAAYGNRCRTVYLKPPSRAELLRRLRARGLDDLAVLRRLQADEAILAFEPEADDVVLADGAVDSVCSQVLGKLKRTA